MQGQEDLTGEHMRHKSAPKDIEGGAVAGSAGSIFFGGVGVLKLLNTAAHQVRLGKNYFFGLLLVPGMKKYLIMSPQKKASTIAPVNAFVHILA